MKYRVNTFYAAAAEAADATVVIPINITDVISQIVLEVRGLATTVTNLAPIARAITQIDVIDGSDVLFSLDGEQAEALDWYNNKGTFRANYNMMLTGNTAVRYIGINFGRYLYDPIYALDPKRFNNLQLRVTVDSGVGGNTSNSVTLAARACVFETPPTELRGFFMSKEFKQWTMAAATHNYCDLPLDYPYRALFFRAFLAGTETNQCVSNFKLSEDQDKKILFDDDPWDLHTVLNSRLPKVSENYFFACSNLIRYLYVAATTKVVANGTRWAGSALDANVSCYNGDGGRLDTYSYPAGQNYQIHVEGDLPHSVYMLPFGDINDPSDLYDVRNLGSLRTDITGGAASQGYLFAQQVRSY